MTITIYTSPDGTEYRALPRTWGGATNITERWAFAHGWTTAERETPDPAEPLPTTCTKYELVNALQELDPELLTTLRAAYAQYDDLQFYWNTVQELDRNNPDFARLALAVGATGEQLDAVFARIAEDRGTMA